MKNCFFLKDKIQALIEAGVLCLNKETKNVNTSMISLEFSQEMLGVKVPDGVMAPQVVMWIT